MLYTGYLHTLFLPFYLKDKELSCNILFLYVLPYIVITFICFSIAYNKALKAVVA